MKWLYLALNLGSAFIPFVYSFHPKLAFYKKWKFLFPALIITAAVFIIWDVIFTQNGVWGFNRQYCLGTNWFGLPLEEWLFFFCIPYACIFIHYSIKFYFPKFELDPVLTKYLSIFFMTGLSIVALINFNKSYTFYSLIICSFLILIGFLFFKDTLKIFYCTFLIMLIPFFIVNGVLTGSLIEQEVVWYNNNENLGLRILTIPVEDIFYAFSLVFLNLILIEVPAKIVPLPDKHFPKN